MSELPRIAYLAFGGTIASAPDPHTGELVPTLSGADLLAAVPALRDIAEIEIEEFPIVPSFAITTAQVAHLALRITAALAAGAAGVVISHGTDTVEETAYLLATLLPRTAPIVLTAAMRDRTAPVSDGAANLIAAFRVAATPEAAELGPVVVLADEVHAARFVTKEHTTRLSTFGSPGAGPMGEIVEGRLELWWKPAWTDYVGEIRPGADPDVELVRIVLGQRPALLEAVRDRLPDGLVIEGTGGGHVPPWLLPILDRVVAAGRPVILATRVSAGANLTSTYRAPGSEMDLIDRGAIPAGNLRGHKARLRLWTALAAKDTSPTDHFPVGRIVNNGR